MYAAPAAPRPRVVGLGLPIVIAILLVVLAAGFYYLSASFRQTPIDVARSAAARQYLETNLAARWPTIPSALAALDTVEVRGPVLYVLTTAPSTGDVRQQVAPTCFVATSYVESNAAGVKSFQIVAADGTTFRFHPTWPCLLAGY